MAIDTLTKLPQKFFVTGTDTEVGKTYCSSLLVRYFQEQMGESVFPFKPISAGVDVRISATEKSINGDAFELWKACNEAFSIDQINPIVFEQPIAPHIAAIIENRELNSELLDKALKKIPTADRVLIEGAGGWLLPLNETELLSDWVANHKIPVVLVVGIKLGCLNHSLLSAQAIQVSGCKLVGWIPNFIDGETEIGRENVNYLKKQFMALYSAPCLFEVQKGQTLIL